MAAREYLGYVVVALLFIFLLSLLLGQVFGQPLFLTYVETESMSPTIEPNDGYILLPDVLVGEITEGDIILFEANEINDGGLTTHRVVDVTEQGYITRGDNNPFTDQDAGEPVVADGQVRGVALQIGGGPVVIPYVGSFVGGIQWALVGGVGFIMGLFGLDSDPSASAIGLVAVVGGLLLLAVSLLLENQRYDRNYVRSRGSFFLQGEVVTVLLILIVLVPANAAMLLPAGVAEFSVLVTDDSPDSPGEVGVGGDIGVNYTAENSGLVPVVVVLEPASAGVEIDTEVHTLSRQSYEQTGVMLRTPDEPGMYPRFVQETRYLKVLPESWLVSLHRTSPLLALAAVNVVVGTVLASVSLSLFGTGRLRVRSRARDVPGFDFLRRYL